MTDIITKVSIWGQVVPIWWGSEWQEVVYLTQAEYDALPASKLTDGKIYKVKTTGVPWGVLTAGAGIDITNNIISADMTTAVYDNTTSWMTATNVQDAIDEVYNAIYSVDWTSVTHSWIGTQIKWTTSSTFTPTEDLIASFECHWAAWTWTTQWTWLQENIWNSWVNKSVYWTEDVSWTDELLKWHTYRLTGWTSTSSYVVCNWMYKK